MWSLKLVVTLVTVWGEVHNIEITLERAYRSERVCEAYRPMHETVLAFTVARRDLLANVMPLSRITVEGFCVPPKPQIFPYPDIVGIPT